MTDIEGEEPGVELGGDDSLLAAVSDGTKVLPPRTSSPLELGKESVEAGDTSPASGAYVGTPDSPSGQEDLAGLFFLHISFYVLLFL